MKKKIIKIKNNNNNNNNNIYIYIYNICNRMLILRKLERIDQE